MPSSRSCQGLAGGLALLAHPAWACSPGAQPLAGDWNGDRSTTPGVKRGTLIAFRNALSGGAADLEFDFGIDTDIPLAGDWDGNGSETIGVFRRSTCSFYLRNSHSAGPADLLITLGVFNDGFEP